MKIIATAMDPIQFYSDSTENGVTFGNKIDS